MTEQFRCNQGSRNCSTIHADEGHGTTAETSCEIARAINSLPVPVSPVSRTVESVGATLTREKALLAGRERPYNLFKHEGLIDLLAERHVLVLRRSFRSLNFFESFF